VTAGGQHVALDVPDGRFVVHRSGGGPVCADRPNGRDREGTTICAFPDLVIDLLKQPARSAWVQARVVGDHVVVTGLAAADTGIVVTAPPSRGGGGESVVSTAGGPTVTLSREGSPRSLARPFAVTLRRTRARYVLVSAAAGAGPAIGQRVPIGQVAPAALGGFVQLRYASREAAAHVALRAQERLQGAGVARAQVLGDGDRLTAWVTAPQVGKARAALMPGVLTVYDWEASALLTPSRTVAEGLATGDQRARAISQNAGSAAQGLRRSDAETLARALPDGGGRIVQTFDRGPGAPHRWTDPRARFYVLRGRPAMTGSDLVSAVVGSDAQGQPTMSVRFTAHGRAAFHRLTRAISRRGQGLALPGTPPALAAQHFALVVDGRLVALPSVDPTALPDGIDGRDGAVLEGGFTGRTVSELARQLDSGPLPGLVELSRP
jgi:hypothetical protein